MTDAKLARMANDIARNLAAMHGDRAAAATAEHLTAFWSPGMRRALTTLADGGGTALDDIVLAAVALLRRHSAA